MAGDLSDRSPVDLCLHLAGERATGTLVLAGPRGEAVLVFADGALAGSRPPTGRTARLGERLVSAGRLDRPDLDALLAEQAADDTAPALGLMLVDRGLATPDAVRLFVQEQVLETLLDAISWFEGTWEFSEAQAPAPGPGGGLRIPVDRALMEVRRRAAERERVAAVIGSPATVPRPAGEHADASDLSTDAFTVLTAVDGERSVGEIAQALGISHDEASRQLYRLALQGRVALADTSETPDDATPTSSPTTEEDTLPASPLTGTAPVQLADDGWAERRQVGTTTALEPEPWVGWANARQDTGVPAADTAGSPGSSATAPAPAPAPQAAPPAPAAPPSPTTPAPPLWSSDGGAAPDVSRPAAAADPSAVPARHDMDADTRRALFSELHEVGRSVPGFAEEPAPEPEPPAPAAQASAPEDESVATPAPDPAPSPSLSRSDVSDLLRELHALNLDD